MSEAEARALLDAIANSPADLHRIVSIVQILVPKDQREKLERGCIHMYACMCMHCIHMHAYIFTYACIRLSGSVLGAWSLELETSNTSSQDH